MTGIQLGAPPLADFNEPIAMLTDCHRRIEFFLEVLQKVEQRYGGGQLDEEGRRALESALHYFADFAPRHTADEEHSLFPRMRGANVPEARAAMEELELLEQDHRRCEAGHMQVERHVLHWLETGHIDGDSRSRLRSTLDELATRYATHILQEEQRVFPLASRILTAEQVQEIGEEMRARRLLPHSNLKPVETRKRSGS